jgi:hypothetical protein
MISYPTTLDLSYSRGWNIVSVPLEVDDANADVLFPGNVSDAFGYDDGYSAATNLQNGRGYWIKFPGSVSVDETGIFQSSQDIGVARGWNLIGNLSELIAVSSITSDPPGMTVSPFYAYNNGYSVAATLEPGKGYWVKVPEEGYLHMSTDTFSPANSRVVIQPTNELPPPPPGEQLAASGFPDVFSLLGNYPNPFNPTTTISFGLPVDSRVTLKVYNALGQEVMILNDGVVEAGFHESQLDAAALSSGIYFYRLDATSVENPTMTFSQSRKIVLLK